jgi:hypothetical protein
LVLKIFFQAGTLAGQEKDIMAQIMFLIALMRAATRLIPANVSANQGPTLEATQWQIDGFFCQPPCKCHQNRVASLGD